MMNQQSTIQTACFVLYASTVLHVKQNTYYMPFTVADAVIQNYLQYSKCIHFSQIWSQRELTLALQVSCSTN